MHPLIFRLRLFHCVTMIFIAPADHKAQTEWALGIKKSIVDYLQEGSDGKFYYRMVDTVLSRDKNWVRWKMENCHPFTRDRIPTVDSLDAKSGAQKAIRKSVLRVVGKSPGLEYMSSDGTEKGLTKIKEADRYVPLVRMVYCLPSAHQMSVLLRQVQLYMRRRSKWPT